MRNVLHRVAGVFGILGAKIERAKIDTLESRVVLPVECDPGKVAPSRVALAEDIAFDRAFLEIDALEPDSPARKECRLSFHVVLPSDGRIRIRPLADALGKAFQVRDYFGSGQRDDAEGRRGQSDEVISIEACFHGAILSGTGWTAMMKRMPDVNGSVVYCVSATVDQRLRTHR